VRTPRLAPRAIALQASGNLDAPGIRIFKNVQAQGCGVSDHFGVPGGGGIHAGGRVCQSNVRCFNVRQSARHQSSRTNQVVIIKSSKNARSQSQARHEWRRSQACGTLLRLPFAC
jgi:hypothetical protein